MYIEANRNTFLKREPDQANLLPKGSFVNIQKGNSYRIEEILDTHHLHEKLRLSGKSGVTIGDWWVFRPHWDYLEKTPTMAIFTLKQPLKQDGNKYVWGNLSFSDGFWVTASSGAPGYQYRGAHKIRGSGLIPTSDQWRINLPGYHLDTKGIEGWFWHITPDPFMGRWELGLHRDANVLGSAGCIVVPTKVFPTLETYLRERYEEGYKQIKLRAQYT